MANSKIIFENPPHQIENYKVQHDGQQYRAAVFGYSKLAAMADVAKGYYEYSDWSNSSSSYQNPYFARDEYPQNIQHARRMVGNFKLPDKIRNEAQFLSRELVSVLQVEGAPKMLKHQIHGRFDRRAVVRSVKDLQAGKFSRENTRPYVRRERVAPKPPHVAIVADGSAAAMWTDPEYIPRVAALMLGVTWSCEAVGCETTSMIARHSASSSQDFDVIIYVLNDNEIKTPLNDYAPLFHRDLYRNGNLLVFNSHVETMKLLCKGYNRPSPSDISSRGGGHGYSFAKHRGADIIITIGDMKIIHDKRPEKARLEKENNIHIEPNTNLRDAIHHIAKKLAELKHLRQAA